LCDAGFLLNSWASQGEACKESVYKHLKKGPLKTLYKIQIQRTTYKYTINNYPDRTTRTKSLHLLTFTLEQIQMHIQLTNR